jgi:hypothetical protein
MVIEVKAHGGVVVRWHGGLTMLVDPTGAWLVLAGRVLTRVTMGVA